MIGLFSTPDLDSNCKLSDAPQFVKRAKEFLRLTHKDASQTDFVCAVEKKSWPPRSGVNFRFDVLFDSRQAYQTLQKK
ncbi:MAG: hypothetical protein JST85_13675 [Acidobacteria bacterium]|nr:hypothetical protein [Acidobacteriota bacterium]